MGEGQLITWENPLVPSRLGLVEASPSAKDGLTWSTEEQMRLLGSHLIGEAGKLLKMPQDIAMACTLIAGKVEECYRRVREIVNVYYFLYQNLRMIEHCRMMEYISNEYYGWRERVTTAEYHVLRELGFHVQPHHPVSLLINYLRALEIVDPDVAQQCLDYVNDCSYGIANLLFQPNVIACAAIQLTCAKLHIDLPCDPPWYLVFDVEAEILACCVDEINNVYQVLFDLALPLIPSELQLFVDTIKNSSNTTKSNVMAKEQHRSKSTRAVQDANLSPSSFSDRSQQKRRCYRSSSRSTSNGHSRYRHRDRNYSKSRSRSNHCNYHASRRVRYSRSRSRSRSSRNYRHYPSKSRSPQSRSRNDSYSRSGRSCSSSRHGRPTDYYRRPRNCSSSRSRRSRSSCSYERSRSPKFRPNARYKSHSTSSRSYSRSRRDRYRPSHYGKRLDEAPTVGHGHEGDRGYCSSSSFSSSSPPLP